MPKKTTLRKKSPRRVRSEKQSSWKNKLLTIIVTCIVFVALLITASKYLTLAADKSLVKDDYLNALRYYTFATQLNPYNTSASTGVNIANVIQEERKRELDPRQGRAIHVSEIRVKTTPIPPTPAPSVSPLIPNEPSLLGSRTLLVPVLMYHYIRINPYPSDKVGYNLSVTPANFSEQMDYLVAQGYHTISLDELGAALFEDAMLPEKPIVITFDDGYRDSYTDAYPILKTHGLQGVNFVVTGFVGTPNYLTWEMISEMKSGGVFTFGAHTVHHLALTYSSDKNVLEEMKESKKTLEEHLGYPINWFAYPYGNVDVRVAGLVPEAGFVGAFGTQLGSYQSTHYRYTLPRIRIGGTDNISSFAEKLPWK